MVPFIITALQNKTELALNLEIASLPEDIIDHVSVPSGTTTKVNLPFGRAEDSEYPLGYIITNFSEGAFKQIRVMYERTEDPLGDVLREHTELLRKLFIHHWSLYVDNKKIATYQAFEHTTKGYLIGIDSGTVYVQRT